MKLTINGIPQDIEAATLAEALAALELSEARVATALDSGRPDGLSPASAAALEDTGGAVLASVAQRLLGAARASVSER